MSKFNYVQSVEERLIIKATEKKQPINATFELTPCCNMSCKMCFIRLENSEINNHGRLLTIDEWLNLAKDLKDMGTLFLLLTGGEPLLYPQFSQLYIELIKMGMIVTINTNGTLITENIANLLQKYKPRRVNVTLYGASNETYARLCNNPQGFKQVINGLNLLKERNIDVKLNGTLVPENQNEVENLLNIANEFDYPIKIDTYIFPTHRNDKLRFSERFRLKSDVAAQKYLEIMKCQKTKEYYENYRRFTLENCYKYDVNSLEIACRAGKSSVWITWNGEMTPCVFLNKPSYSILNYKSSEAWQMLCENVGEVHLPIDCGKCEKRKICQVCVASVYCENGNFDEKPRYMCQYTEEIVQILKKELNKE